MTLWACTYKTCSTSASALLSLCVDLVKHTPPSSCCHHPPPTHTPGRTFNPLLEAPPLPPPYPRDKKTQLHMQVRGCKFSKFQEVKLQELPDEVGGYWVWVGGCDLCLYELCGCACIACACMYCVSVCVVYPVHVVYPVGVSCGCVCSTACTMHHTTNHRSPLGKPPAVWCYTS